MYLHNKSKRLEEMESLPYEILNETQRQEIEILKPNDQEMAQKCFEMFKKFTKDNPDIEPTIWMSACFSVMVSSYIISDFSFEEFQSDVSQAIEHYKDWWDEHEGF